MSGGTSLMMPFPGILIEDIDQVCGEVPAALVSQSLRPASILSVRLTSKVSDEAFDRKYRMHRI